MENTNNLCHSVVMEIRPRLQSVNVFISFDQALPHYHDIKVKVNDGIHLLKTDGKIEKIPLIGFNIVQDSISSLSLKENYCTFRFRICNKNFNDEFDVLEEGLEGITISNKFCLDKILNQKYKYKIKCIKCLQSFHEDVKFNKILPLPSENFDFNEWFCHAPKSGTQFSLEPGPLDLFYASYYFNISFSLIKENVTISHEESSCLLCKNCSSEVGVLKGNMCKLYFHTTELNFNETKYSSTALDCIFRIIRESMQDSFVGCSKFLFYVKSNFIMLWVIEKKLKLFVRDSKNSGKINEVAKVLFNCSIQENVVNNDDEIRRWQRDHTVNSVEVSKDMFEKFRKHLEDMHEYIPEDFSMSNGFYISYVSLYV